MLRPLVSPPLRTAGFLALASLLVAGLALTLSSCQDALSVPGAASVQTSEALDLLPHDADVVGMVDFASARRSDAVRAATGGAGLGLFSPDGSADFDAFVRTTGFDPETDLDRVYVAASEGSGRDHRAAFVAYGRFDREKIERYLGSQSEMQVEMTDVDGVPVYLTTSEDGARGGFALPNNEMVLAGDESTLRAMLGRVNGNAPSANAEMDALLARVAYPDGAWFVGRGLGAHAGAMPDGAPPMAAAAQLADAVVVSMGFESDGVPFRAFVEPRQPGQTGDLADLLRGSLSAARMTVKDAPAALDVLDRAKVDTRDGGVEVRAFLTPQFLAEVRES